MMTIDFADEEDTYGRIETEEEKDKINLVGNKKTCCICKNREPSYFMNKVNNIDSLKDGIRIKYKNRWICDTCLS